MSYVSTGVTAVEYPEGGEVVPERPPPPPPPKSVRRRGMSGMGACCASCAQQGALGFTLVGPTMAIGAGQPVKQVTPAHVMTGSVFAQPSPIDPSMNVPRGHLGLYLGIIGVATAVGLYVVTRRKRGTP